MRWNMNCDTYMRKIEDYTKDWIVTWNFKTRKSEEDCTVSYNGSLYKLRMLVFQTVWHVIFPISPAPSHTLPSSWLLSGTLNSTNHRQPPLNIISLIGVGFYQPTNLLQFFKYEASRTAFVQQKLVNCVKVTPLYVHEDRIPKTQL